jgi:pyruvate/2-oxoglutarate dehydrogenase complex dihydrolipoamide dehydrogenase (E3) component/uncharacterized membrane protein YdjX (TVP38/TMEM64 family)
MGITVVFGEAAFTGKRSVTVLGTTYHFKKAIIATGSTPRHITVPGLVDADILTNQNIFQLNHLPDKLLIIGSGPIGLELGQAFAMLGVNVTITTIDQTVGRLEDEAIRPLIVKACTNLGITFITNAAIKEVVDHVATFTVTTANSDKNEVAVHFDKVLIAIGRTPNLPAGLTAAGVLTTTNGIAVNSNYQTTNHHIYALGDVADRLKFTHVADTVARGVVKHILSRGVLPVRVGAIPKITYLEPEIGQVGQSWEEAVATYGAEHLYRLEIPLTRLDRAVTDGTTSGVLVVIAKRLTGTIVGVHMAGPRAGEIIALFTLAIDNRLSLWRIGQTTYAYPTYAQLAKLAATTFIATQLTNLRSDLWRLFKRYRLILILLLGWMSLLIGIIWYMTTHGHTVLSLSLLLFSFFSTSWWGIVAFIIVYALRPLTFLPATALSVLAGTVFGFWWGVLYTLIGATTGAALAYAIGRFFGQSTTPRNQPASLFQQFAEVCQTRPFMSILLMRLLFLPYDAVNYGAGLLRVPFWPYLSATIIGTILGTIMFVSLGAALTVSDIQNNGFSTDIIDRRFIILSGVIFGLSLILSRVAKKYQR